MVLLSEVSGANLTSPRLLLTIRQQVLEPVAEQRLPNLASNHLQLESTEHSMPQQNDPRLEQLVPEAQATSDRSIDTREQLGILDVPLAVKPFAAAMETKPKTKQAMIQKL
jgi:hypothetical protein